MSVAPTFEVLSGLNQIWRRGLSPDKIVDSLKVNSGARSFPYNTMVVNGFTAREGEWLSPDGSGKWGYSASSDRIARPLWQDPQERWDSEGGVTLLQGPWTVKTNMVDIALVAVGDELCVGTLDVAHPAVPSGVGLVGLATLAAGSLHTVVAIVEEIGSDYVIITNVGAGYIAAGSV